MINDTMLVQTLGYVFLFISGAFIGSFLNVVSDRLINKKSIIFGRSICEFCEKELGVLELVPVVSFLIQRGKCKLCNKELSLYYPTSEVLTGLMFVGAAFLTNVFTNSSPVTWVSFFYLAIVGCIYIILLLTDLKYRILPNRIVFPAIIFVVLYLVITSAFYLYSLRQNLLADDFGKYLLEVGYFDLQIQYTLTYLGYTFLSSLAIGLFFWILFMITRGRGMGGGDIKLALLIGLFNGFPTNIVGIVIVFLSGCIFSIFMLLIRKRKLKDTIPFGPFLILGSVVALVFGQQLLSLYLNLL